MSIFTSLKSIGKTGVASVAGKPVVTSKLASTLKDVNWGSVVNTGLDVYNKISSKDGKPAYPEAGSSVNISPDDPKYSQDPSKPVVWYKQTWFTVGVSVLGAVGVLIAIVKLFFKKGKSKSKLF